MMQADGQVPSVFDEDPDLERRKVDREYRRVRSALVTSGVLIVLPWLIRHLQRHGVGDGSSLVFAGVMLTVLGVYIALGAFAMRKPFYALILGTCIYALMQLVSIILVPDEPFTAWIFRALVVMNLLMPIQKARALQRRVII